MLEVYLLDGTEEMSIGKFLKKITDMGLVYTINKAPKKHEKILGCYVESAYKAAGIHYLPLPKAHMRILLASETVGPITGQTLRRGTERYMFASHPDPDTLCSIALHELGHALQAVKKSSHTCVMSVKAKRELMQDAKSALVQEGALEKLSRQHPDGMIELDGAHCLAMGCVMQVVTAGSAINANEPFCVLCLENVTKSIRKINDEFDDTPSYCGDCEYLRKCMWTKEYVYEGSDICPEFSAKLTND